MSITIYQKNELSFECICHKTVAVLGYGNQGRAHAQNLNDSGVSVVVGLRDGSPSFEMAMRDGLRAMSMAKAVACADVVAILAPDETHGQIYADILPHIRQGATLVFAHGFAVHYGIIKPRDDLDVVLVAPKGTGHALRNEYQQGRGLVCLVAQARDVSGRALDTARAYATAIGANRACAILTTFKDETETDLFGEQAVLCGGVAALVTAAFETLVSAGYPAHLAYFECLHELKLTVDIMHARGIVGMNQAVSNNAEFGGYLAKDGVINAQSKTAMAQILSRIQSGQYAKDFIQECQQHYPKTATHRKIDDAHFIQTIGQKMRHIIANQEYTAILDE